jgi:hypothetical protein
MEDRPDPPPRTIDLPTPTAWPIITAFSITLLLAGLVTNFAVSVVGFICGIFGAIGWFRDVFPHPKHEPVTVRPLAERAAPIATSNRTVEHLTAGQAGHRSRVPIEVTPYSAGILGGLAGGAAMAILAMLYGLIAQGSIWYPINLLAAAGVPSLAEASIEQLREFSLAGLIVAILSHGLISILVGLLYTTLLPMLPPRFEWFWGGIITPLMWTGLLYPTMGIINPALAARIDWPWFIACQIAFGVVGGFVVFKSGKIETMQTWPLAAKMGVEGQEKEKTP